MDAEFIVDLSLDNNNVYLVKVLAMTTSIHTTSIMVHKDCMNSVSVKGFPHYDTEKKIFDECVNFEYSCVLNGFGG